MTVANIDVSNFVEVDVNISPLAIPYSSFGVPLILGDSDVIDTTERLRTYSSITAGGADFGNTSPEYLALQTFFSQSPQPAIAMVGRWASSATAGLLHGATLTPTQQLLANFTAITTGSLKIAVDGGASHDITALDFAAALNLNGVASILQTALAVQWPGVTCVWDASNERFDIVSATTGATSSVSAAGPAATGVDVSGLLGLSLAAGADVVTGVAAESPLAAVQACANVSNQWYGATFPANTAVPLSIADHVAVAAYILASSRLRIYGVTICGANAGGTECLDPEQTSDLASALKSLNNKRIAWFYSATSQSAVLSLMGRIFTVNYSASLSTITLAYKQAPGIPAENLTQTQFNTLIAKGGNANIAVSNGAIMMWPGQMAQGYWMDEVIGVDWFSNEIQTDVFNLMYQTTTKIPQTNDGNNQIASVIENGCAAAVNNGLVAPGQWNASGFGMLTPGMTLPKGWYVWFPDISTQSQADREARKSVPFQVAAKLAGAVHTVDVVLNINR